MSDDLRQLAEDLQNAATKGAPAAGEGAVRAGAWMTETDLRVPGASFVVGGLGSLSARIGATHRRGVYQEAAPTGVLVVDCGSVAGEMADVAAAIGVSEIAR